MGIKKIDRVCKVVEIGEKLSCHEIKNRLKRVYKNVPSSVELGMLLRTRSDLFKITLGQTKGGVGNYQLNIYERVK